MTTAWLESAVVGYLRTGGPGLHTLRRAVTAGVGAALITALTGCAVAAETTAVVTADAPAGAAVAPEPVREITVETPPARTAAPALQTTGLTWKPILESLTGYSQWILANPNPDKVADVAAPGCAFSPMLRTRVQGLLTSHAHQETSRPEFLAVTGPAAAGEGATDADEAGHTVAAPIGNRVTIHAVATRGAQPILSRAGAQISSVAPLPQTRLRITLTRGADQKWRFCTIQPANSATGTTALL